MNVTKRKRKNETDICWSLSFCWRILGTYLGYGYSWLQGNDIVTNLDFLLPEFHRTTKL